MTDEPIRVLYLDADPGVLDEATDRLASERDDLAVETAQSARVARERLADERFDCVVSGDTLSDGSGLELLEAVRETYPDLPFVVHADADPAAVVDEALAAGATNYLQRRGTEQYSVLADVVTRTVEQYRRSRILGETTTFYRTVLENVPDTVLLTDAEGEFTWVCPNVHRVFGYSAREVVELGSVCALFGEEPVDRSAVRRRGAVENVETTVTTKSGTGRIVLVTATETSIDGADVLYTVRDITGVRKSRFVLPAIDTLPVHFAILDADGTILWTNRAWREFGAANGLAMRRATVGVNYLEVAASTGDGTARRAVTGLGAVLSGERAEYELEYPCHSPEERRWFLMRAVPFAVDDDRYAAVAHIDVTDRKREQQRTERVLTAVQEVVPALQTAESRQDVADVVVDTVPDVLDHVVGGVYYYDETTGALEPAATTPTAEQVFDEVPTFTGDDSLAWRAFAEERAIHAEEVHSHDDVYNPETPLESELVLPLGSHGVALVGSREKAAFPEWEREFASTLATVVETALDRIAVQDTVPAYERAIERTEDQVEQLRSLARLACNLTQGIVSDATRSAVVSDACEALLSVASFEFAWFGEVDGDDVVMSAWACDGGHVTDALLDRECDRGCHPARRALETGTSHVRSDFVAGDRNQWIEEALTRGYQACCAVPLVYGDTRHGVLTVFADDPTAFDDETVRVLDELVGPALAYALTATDRRRALASDRRCELEFRVTDEKIPSVSLAEQLACELTLEEVAPYADGSVAAFYTVDGAAPERVAEAARDMLAVEAVRVTEDGTVQLTQRTGVSLVLADYGWTLRAATADEHGARITVGVPDGGNARRAIETVETHYPDADLLAKRTGVSGGDRHGIGTAFERELTDRQREVLETAYRAGYVGHSRECTGAEVADRLDIAQPTFNQHFWTGLERLLATALDDG